MQQKRFLTLSSLLGILALISLYSCKKNSSSPTDNTFTYDGFTYHTVTIPGAGTWTVENAQMTHFRNGALIRNAKTAAEWVDSTEKKINNKIADTGAWCYYNNTNSVDTQKIYGKLYNWYAVKDARGLAPQGYRVATRADFINLRNVLGDSAGQKLKSVLYWTGDAAGTAKPNRNSTGFTAVPAGLRYDVGIFSNLGRIGYFWSSMDGYIEGSFWGLYEQMVSLGESDASKLAGYSVRFVKD